MAHRTLGNMFPGYCHGYRKVTDERPDEDVHRARSTRVPGEGASVPVELWCAPTRKLSEPHSLGIFMETFVDMMDYWLNLHPFFSLEDAGGGGG